MAKDPLVGSLVGGRYRVTALLGKGAMGVVYEAMHEDLGRPAALKVLGPAWASDETAVARFQREARTASGLGHPNIITIYDFGRLEDGRPYLAMERLRGESLADALAREGHFELERAARVVRQIADALDAVHGEGLIHRDIKPDNIFLAHRSGAADSVQLLDFGLAAFSQPEHENKRLTLQGQVHGTPLFMAPEAVSGDEPLTLRADVYALGVLAFEMIAGALPFTGSSAIQILNRKCRMPAPSMFTASGRSFPGAVEAVVARALERKPALRPPSAGSFARDLWQAACPGVPYSVDVAARPPIQAESVRAGAAASRQDSEPPVLPVSPLARALPALLLGALLAAGGGLYWFASGDEPTMPPHAEPAAADVDNAARKDEAPSTAAAKSPAAMLAAAQGEAAQAPVDEGLPPAAPSAEASEGGEAAPPASATDEPRGEPPKPNAVGPRGTPAKTGSRKAPPGSTSDHEKQTLDVQAADQLRSQGIQALMQGRLSAAQRKLEAAVQLNPGDASAWRSLGLTHERLKQASEAARAYRRYLQLAPGAADASSVRSRLDALDQR